jgi:hypothetical protein
MAGLLAGQGVTVVELVPSVLAQYLPALAAAAPRLRLRAMVTGGEALTAAMVAAIYSVRGEGGRAAACACCLGMLHPRPWGDRQGAGTRLDADPPRTAWLCSSPTGAARHRGCHKLVRPSRGHRHGAVAAAGAGPWQPACRALPFQSAKRMSTRKAGGCGIP